MDTCERIETCRQCASRIAWIWIPPVIVLGRPLAGTGLWEFPLLDDLCDRCLEARRIEKQLIHLASRRQYRVQQTFGARRAREFAFDSFIVAPGNRAAFDLAAAFKPEDKNLYLWGACGVGKTHLAYAMARRAIENGRSADVVTPPQLSRRVRMKEPALEQSALDSLIGMDVLVIDELGMGRETPYQRQLLQEVLDGRSTEDRNGIVVTSKFSLDALASHLGDDAIPSRLAECCISVEVRGKDHRLSLRETLTSQPSSSVSAPA